MWSVNQDLKQKCKVVESENGRTKHDGLLKRDVFYDWFNCTVKLSCVELIECITKLMNLSMSQFHLSEVILSVVINRYFPLIIIKTCSSFCFITGIRIILYPS